MDTPGSGGVDDGSGAVATMDPLADLVAQRHRFLAFVRGRVASAAHADDIVQSAFAKAAQQQAALREALHATAWFYRILRNEIIDQARRAQAHGRMVERAAQLDEPLSDDPRDRKSPCRCVLAVLGTLRSDYAGLIQVVELEGVAVGEAALLFGITANNASVRLHRAKAALREGLAARCGKCALEGCGDCSCRSPSA